MSRLPFQPSASLNASASPRRSRRPRWLLAILGLLIPAAIVGVFAVFKLSSPRPAAAQPAPVVPAAPVPSAPAAPAAPTALTPSPLGSGSSTPPDLIVPTTRPAPTTQPVDPVPPTSADVQARLTQGLSLIGDGKLIEGRAQLSVLLFDPTVSLAGADAQAIRDTLTSINQELIFGKKVVPGDTVSEYYAVQDGDLLMRIASKYRTPYQLIESINQVDARRIRVGQKLKVVKGPFHAIVNKTAFRMDVYLKDAAGQMIYVRSFAVGLGEENSTPAGAWIIAPGGKLSNPGYTNPQTHQYHAPNDPANPIGEHWLALQGVDDNTKAKRGFALHGTIQPDSIGRMMSMGCIRLTAPDVEMVYKLLVEKFSTVQVTP